MARVMARNVVRYGWAGWGRTTQNSAYSDTATAAVETTSLGRPVSWRAGRSASNSADSTSGWRCSSSSSRSRRSPGRRSSVSSSRLAMAASRQLELGNLAWDVTCSTGTLNRRWRIAGRLPLSQRDTPGGKVDSTIRS